jgi:hypothetical protein
MHANDPLLFQIGKTAFQQGSTDPTTLIRRSDRKIVDLEGPTLVK